MTYWALGINVGYKRMKVFSQELSLRAFLTIGPYEHDREFRVLLRDIAKKGLVMFGIIGAVVVVFHAVGHTMIKGSEIVWDYSRYQGGRQYLILDKLLILILCVSLLMLSRTDISLKWTRILIFILVWFTTLAMLIEDVVGADTTFTMAWTSVALLFAAVMVPYTGWQVATLSVTVIISTIVALDFMPVVLGIELAEPLRIDLGQLLFISVVSILLTGTSSQIYINRYEQFKARKQAEKLSQILEERAEVLEMLKNKSERQAQKILEHEKLKDQFFANISHEFRTPLTLILGPLQDMLDSEEGNGKTKVRTNLLRIMKSNGEQLLNLINQLLDLSKIDAREIRLNVKNIDLASFIIAKVQSFGPLAESQEVSLDVEIEDTEIQAEVDPGHMEQVISNLISNAIKFTTKGGSVTVSLSDYKGSDEMVSISVRDDGVGIPEEDLTHIFDRFYQSRGPNGTITGGTGIGLALVKEIVDLHGGSIEVNSKLGEGSEFVVILHKAFSGSVDKLEEGSSRLAVANDRERTEWEPADLYDEEISGSADPDAPKVLLVDDNPDILAYLGPRLSSRYNVMATESSKEALEWIKSKKIDLIISDVMMPEPDGFELCRFVKESSDWNHIPVILLTARVSEESRIEGLEHGADDYISKPFSASELLARIENLIELRRMLRDKFSEEIRLKGKEVEVDSEDARFLKEVQSVIEKHMENSNFGVDWLADEVNLSTRQLQRRLRSITDLSAGGYIRMMRLERAGQLIIQEWGNVSEVAYKVGFQDAKYFSKLFKQTFGSTPTEYAENEA